MTPADWFAVFAVFAGTLIGIREDALARWFK